MMSFIVPANTNRVKLMFEVLMSWLQRWNVIPFILCWSWLLFWIGIAGTVLVGLFKDLDDCCCTTVQSSDIFWNDICTHHLNWGFLYFPEIFSTELCVNILLLSALSLKAFSMAFLGTLCWELNFWSVFYQKQIRSRSSTKHLFFVNTNYQ